jgi:hypothetical protein
MIQFSIIKGSRSPVRKARATKGGHTDPTNIDNLICAIRYCGKTNLQSSKVVLNHLDPPVVCCGQQKTQAAKPALSKEAPSEWTYDL